MTDYRQIEKWWEVVMSAYLLVSLHSHTLNPTIKEQETTDTNDTFTIANTFASHEWWDTAFGWKNILNNLRLVLQAFVLMNYPICFAQVVMRFNQLLDGTYR